MGRSGSGGYQWMSSTVNENGETVTNIARLDVNPNSAHIMSDGAHLNIETQINGRIVSNIHISIDPKTILAGDYP